MDGSPGRVPPSRTAAAARCPAHTTPAASAGQLAHPLGGTPAFGVADDRQGATLIPLSHPKSAFVATPRPRCDGSRPHHALPACGGRIAHDTSASFVLWPGGRVHNHLHVHRRARLLPLCAARPLTERPPSAPVTVRGKHGKHQGRVSAVGCGSKSNLLCKLRRTYQLKAIQPWYEFRPIGAARSLMPPGGALPLLRHRATGVLLVLLGVQ